MKTSYFANAIIFFLLFAKNALTAPAQTPPATNLAVSIQFLSIEILNAHEPITSDGIGEFVFQRIINGTNVRFPSSGYINRKAGETIVPISETYRATGFWDATIDIQNSKSLTVRIEGKEIDDTFDDTLAPIEFTLDFHTLQFVTTYTNHRFASSDFAVTVTVTCQPQVYSPSHPDSTLAYPNTTIDLNWDPCQPAIGIIGYSYLLDNQCCTVPDADIEGTHTAVHFEAQPAGTYYFHIRALDKAGFWSNTAHFRINVQDYSAITDGHAVALDFQLGRNYPNPFNSGTSIPFHLDQPGHVTAQIYSITGQRILTLHDDYLPSGSHQLHWDGLSGDGTPVSSGVYVLQLTTNAGSRFIRMVLTR